ncbi:MAG TPA: glycosyltransferase family 9 protein [Candidatus Eremiobacteraceae bacterium]|nr:glycosyltransferase family 9 protein [Candidatus Eremiobacteraceae bacterium]
MLIRTDRVGDLVLTTPAIASFRRSWPNARIEILANDYNEPVVRNSPDIDVVHVLARSTDRVKARQIAEALGRNVDLAIALSPRTQDYLLAAWSRAPRRLGYVYRRRYLSRIAARYLLTAHAISDADPDLADRHPERPVAHEVRQVQALVVLAGGSQMSDALVLRTGPDDEAFARERVPAGSIGLNLSPRWFNENFGIAPTKLTIERLAALDAPLVVTYGDDVRDIAKSLQTALVLPNITWICGASVLEWAATLARCSVVATVDTGATHVAAAMGVPVVVVFERRYYTLSSQEWSPWRVPSALLCKPTDGADCTTLVDDIVAAVDRLRRR